MLAAAALGAMYRISALAPHLFPLAARHVAPLLLDLHPDANNLGVPQVATATLGRLAGGVLPLLALVAWDLPGGFASTAQETGMPLCGVVLAALHDC
jgi:hypothetical protein